MKYSSWSEDVPEAKRKTDSLIEEQSKAQSVHVHGVYQQALDVMAGAERAATMRQMTHKDYIKAYKSSAGDRKADLKRKASRFEKLST